MAKKQQIILTHGTNNPSAEVIKGLKLGEVLVQHAAEAKDAALHTTLKEGEEAVLVSFPSKEWVDSRIAELENDKTLQTIAGINERLTTAEDEIEALQAADSALETAYKAADDVVRGEFEAADKALEDAYKAADSVLKADYEGLVNGLNERLTTAEGEIEALQAADSALETAYKAADDVVRGEFEAADKALEDAYKAADSVLETAYKAADNALSEKIVEIQGKDAGKSMREVANDELAKQLIPDSAQESLDTLQEIAAWIQAHPGDVAEMNAAIGKNTSDIAALDTAYKAADTALNERLTTAEGEIEALQAADSALETAYKAADDVVRGEFEAADSALETAYKAADSALETAYKAADSALDEKIVALQESYVKEVVVNGKSFTPTENVLDLSKLVIDGGEY